MKKLLTYINSLTLEQQMEFEKDGGISIKYIRKAASTGQRLGAEYCIRIEKATLRKIRCEALRPDIDWEFLRDEECQ